MSMIYCGGGCGGLVDTDAHPETYHERTDAWYCATCEPPVRPATTVEWDVIDAAVERAHLASAVQNMAGTEYEAKAVEMYATACNAFDLAVQELFSEGDGTWDRPDD